MPRDAVSRTAHVERNGERRAPAGPLRTERQMIKFIVTQHWQ